MERAWKREWKGVEGRSLEVYLLMQRYKVRWPCCAVYELRVGHRGWMEGEEESDGGFLTRGVQAKAQAARQVDGPTRARLSR